MREGRGPSGRTRSTLVRGWNLRRPLALLSLIALVTVVPAIQVSGQRPASATAPRYSITPLPFGGNDGGCCNLGGLGPIGPYAAPDGGFAFAYNEANAGSFVSTFTRYRSDGSLISSISPFPVFTYDITFGPDDSSYVAGQEMTSSTTASGVVVRVDTSGTVSTVYTWPGATATNIEFGADGQLYVAVEKNYSLYLDRLDPSSGNVGYELPLGGCGGGLSVRSSTAVWEGCPPIFIPLSNPTATSPAAYGVVGPDGSVFGLGTGGCALSALTKTEPTGSGGWSKSLGLLLGNLVDSACTTGEVVPTPGGGAVISVTDGGHVLLGWVDSNGNLFAHASPTFNGTPIGPQLDIDGNGRAVLSTSVALAQGCDPNKPSLPCEDIEVKVFDKGVNVNETTVSSTTGSSIRLGPQPTTDIAARIINGGIVLWAQSFSGTVNTYTDSFEVIPLPVERDWWRDPARGSPSTPTGTYIALGDSFSSGEGISPYFEPSNKCHRSESAYPTLINVPGSTLTYVGAPGTGNWGFLACSGATTNQVSNKQVTTKRDVANTNWWPLSASTTLVTITAGGDDLGWSKVLTFCYEKFKGCEDDSFRGYATLSAYAAAQLVQVKKNLESLYQKIRKQAPNAKIMVLGYPQLLPASTAEQNCFTLRLGGDGAPGLNNDEQIWFRSEDDALNTTIAGAVASSGTSAVFVPVASTFAGHEVCGSGGEWINGPSLTLVRGGKWKVKLGARTFSFHPNMIGQAEYAAVVNQYLATH